MSQFVVSARKYRPTSFDEVIGQDHIARTLKNALQTGQLAHAFLFTGPRGVGKTTCARILAKVINCQQPKDKVEACNQCPSCLSFNENASFNIIELDAASNNSVEHMRALIEQVRFQPQEGKFKIFIIDEVHMLTTQAFNAFLKTLDEPPSYAIFILATTEKHKILPTILSRCQIFDFKRIQIADAVKQLEIICQKEGKQAEKEALHLIASKADGAMRDALSIFDKIASATGGNITYKDVLSNLNILDYDYYFSCTDAFLREDMDNVLLILDDVIRNGFDPEQFIYGLADHFRELILAKKPGTQKIIDLSAELKERYLHQAALCGLGWLFTSLQLLTQCELNLSRARNKRLHTELALSKITFAKKLLETDIVESMTEKKNDVGEVHFSQKTEEKQAPLLQSTVSENPPSAPVAQTTEVAVQSEKKPVRISNLEEIRRKVLEEEARIADSRKNLHIDRIREVWENYLESNPSMSVQLALKHALLELENKTIKAYVPNAVARDLILQEGNLLDMLRTEVGTPNLSIDINIDREKFPGYEDVKPVQVLTTKEKILAMTEKNPHFQEFCQQLGLKLESEM